VLVSPNNPVGNCLSEADLQRLLEEDVLVVLDEAYFEFADGTLAHLVHDYGNLVVTRTFAKAFGFAGLRLGYAITTPVLAAYLEKVLHHFPVSTVTAAAAVAALQDTAFLKFVRREILAGRTYLEQNLNRIPGVHAYPSKTNFVLVQITAPTITSSDVSQQLMQRGILVRDQGGKEGLVGQFVRITVGTSKQNEACVRSIAAILKA
jgi:histidinol-phosphate aminotransferase